MIVLGTGMGLTSAPATEAIMGVVTEEKAGIGSAVNDATRELGGTLGVAVIGSVYASLYLAAFKPAATDGLPAEAVDRAQDSIGAALVTAGRLGADGARCRPSPRPGSSTGCRPAAWSPRACARPGAVFCAIVLPAQPESSRETPLSPPAGARLALEARAGHGDADALRGAADVAELGLERDLPDPGPRPRSPERPPAEPGRRSLSHPARDAEAEAGRALGEARRSP